MFELVTCVGFVWALSRSPDTAAPLTLLSDAYSGRFNFICYSLSYWNSACLNLFCGYWIVLQLCLLFGTVELFVCSVEIKVWFGFVLLSLCCADLCWVELCVLHCALCLVCFCLSFYSVCNSSVIIISFLWLFHYSFYCHSSI